MTSDMKDTELESEIRHMFASAWQDGVNHLNPKYLRRDTLFTDRTLALIKRETDKAEKRETELLDSLYWMYVQYCSGGHLFMGAGETASELLENAGYITCDGAGRIEKDNGDSYEQSVQLKQQQTRGDE